MKIELGKTYVNRIGQAVTIVEELENPVHEWVFRGDTNWYYSKTGRISLTAGSLVEFDQDLVEEDVSTRLRGVEGSAFNLQQGKNVKEEEDVVNSPSHYLEGGVEAIDMIRLMLTDEEFVGYCKGNMLKYRLRAPFKGKTEEDVNKAAWYYEAARGNR